MTAETEQPTTVPVTLYRADGTTAQVQGEFVAPGIAITPHSSLDGWWHLAHVPSGEILTTRGALQDRDRMRAAAQAITATGIDWSQPAENIAGAEAAAGHPASHIVHSLYYEPEPVTDQPEHGIVEAGDVMHLLPENQPETDAEGYSWGDAATWSASYEANEAEIDAYRSTVDEATI